MNYVSLIFLEINAGNDLHRCFGYIHYSLDPYVRRPNGLVTPEIQAYGEQRMMGKLTNGGLGEVGLGSCVEGEV